MSFSSVTHSRLYKLSSIILIASLSLFSMSSFVNSAEEINNDSDSHIVDISSNYLPTQSKLNLVEDVPIDEIKKNFIAPGVDFSTGPLWVWNDLLTEEQIRATLADLNEQHVNQPFVHPRPGLATPYLSDEWFKLWDAALDEAQKRGMKIWIYDENSYPSGFAGGFVPDAMPESQGSGVDIQLYDELIDNNGAWSVGDSILYVIEQLDTEETRDRTQEVLAAKNAGKLPPTKTSANSRWIVVRKRLAGTSQWFGGKTYVNLLTSGVLEKFLRFTHEAYRARYADKFGNLIPGSFTDEPQVASAGAFSWTDDFAEEFRNRNEYDIVPHLGSLVDHLGDWKKIRYDYYKTVLQLFVERWHKPYAEYCERVGLQYTGHDWEHEWPNAHHVPDNMATAFWRQRPAIDLLMNQFSRNMHSQFGNVRAVRELSSVVHQAGRRRSLCEAYGAGGYDICFADLKRLGDWSFALGVNTMDEHLSYISIRGARKHDHPQTFSYHSPWFEQYSKLEDYWTRLSYILSCGKLTSERFLLIEPTSTEWLYQANNNGDPAQKDQVGVEFTNLLNKLEEEQIDYDLGSEDIIARIGNVNQNELCVGVARYKTVVLPPRLENLDETTVRLLEAFIRNGGTLISLNADFSLVSGLAVQDLNESQNDLKLACQTVKNAKVYSFDDLIKETRKAQPIVLRPSSNGESLFHLTRETKDALILFVCNIDMEKSASGQITLGKPWKNYKVEVFDPATGAVKTCSNLNLVLEPCESVTLVISESTKQDSLTVEDIEPQTIYSQDLISQNTLSSIQTLDDNVLVLDYMTLKLNDETFSEDYFYRINGKFWQKKGFPMSPWDNGVQFKDELITKKFIDESGFELTYSFNKSDAVVDNLRFVVENPSLFDAVYCNDQKVERIPDAWKFDRSFGVFDISAAAKTGINEIKLVASKSTVFCEIMPAWIVGDFSLESETHGFKIVAKHDLTLDKSSDDVSALTKASSELEGVSWLSSGVGFSDRDDRSPSVWFEFKEATKLNAIQVWNYCETNLSKRGVKNVDITLVDEGGKQVGQAFSCQFKQGDGASQLVEIPEMQILANWKIVLTIKSNWNGISYPLAADYVASTEPRSDSAFVGLAEIQFLMKDESNRYVKISKTPKVNASSELVFRNHNRRAQFLTDNSGLYVQENGWAAQGRPFYAGKVDYNFSVPLDGVSQDRPVHFKLSRWRGAVAAILVDGKQIGAIGWKGDTVDLSEAIRVAKSQKQNTLKLTIRIYGTPKNLFGPHHAGKLRGSAWPGSFHSAQQKQPAGSAYDVIEYGLFAE